MGGLSGQMSGKRKTLTAEIAESAEKSWCSSAFSAFSAVK
jgi:hypothetical protein